ncbi:MAG: esterase-like activity of phytase family protein [Synechocystis sp.]|nr:esterase-like activity of phytase family protein [Synechocystis sp.]
MVDFLWRRWQFSQSLISRGLTRLMVGIICLTLTACGLPVDQAQAEPRLFPDLSLEFLAKGTLPDQTLADLPVGGLSGIVYDRRQDVYYAVSDDRRSPRFYTLEIPLDQTESGVSIPSITVTDVTLLKQAEGQPYPPQTLDPEGIALSPRRSLYISSEGVIKSQSPPLIGEFEPQTGQLLNELPIPRRFLPETNPVQGIRDNLGFEPLTIAATSVLPDDPFRLFVATESALAQDIDPDAPPNNAPIRWLHYLINSIGPPVLVSESLYRLDPAPAGTLSHGLSEMLALPKEGYFLSLERTFGLMGFGAKVFQGVNGNATDTANVKSFQPGTQTLTPMRKQLLLDLADLDIDLDNLEGLTLGPVLADGSQSVLLLSDNNFNPEQQTQVLLFRLQGL